MCVPQKESIQRQSVQKPTNQIHAGESKLYQTPFDWPVVVGWTLLLCCQPVRYWLLLSSICYPL